MKKPNSPEWYTHLRVPFGLMALLIVSSSSSFGQTPASNTPSDQSAPAQPTTAPTSADVTSGGSSDSPVTLSPFEVQECTEEDGYVAKATNANARVAVNYIDLAQSVSVINKQLIDDYNIQDTRLLYQYIPNLQQTELDQSANIIIRGSVVSAIYIDGVLGDQITAAPLQFYDRVEVVRGPSSSAFGIGTPGGIINYDTKVPTGKNETSVEVGFGDYSNYLVNVDTQGVIPSVGKMGKVDYRLVAFYDHGNYEILNERHSGIGALLSLRNDLNDTTRIEANIEFNRALYPLSDNNTTVYENQTAYSWLMTALGQPFPGYNGFPPLPNSKPFPTDPKLQVLGNWAGGQLLPPSYLGFGNGFGPEEVEQRFRTSAVFEKSLLDRDLTIRTTVTATSSNHDGQYVTGTLNGYIDANGNLLGALQANGQPAITGLPFPNNLYVGTIQQFAQSPIAQESWSYSTSRDVNIDADYHKKLWFVDWRFDFGVNARSAGGGSKVESYTGTNAQGNIIYVRASDPGASTIFINKGPVQIPNDQTSTSYAWGGYVDLSAKFFGDMITLDAGTRRDVGGNTVRNAVNNKDTSTGNLHSKGAPRYSISVKPLPWLSVYALRAEHDDPPSVIQRYNVFSYGTTPTPAEIAAVNAQYNNFDNPIIYVPSGVLKEYGTKMEFLHGNIVFSADYFDFTTAGGIVTNHFNAGAAGSPTGNAVIVENLLSANHAKGGEIEASGRVTSHLTFTAAFGKTYGLFSHFADGNTHWIQPPTTIQAHLKYNFGSIDGFEPYILFGGIRYSPYWANQDPYIYYQSAQYVFDGGAGIKWDHGMQSLEFVQDNFSQTPPFVSSVPYTANPTQQWFVKYKYRF